jgi:bifunctional UDP-N-acetylglucosamine pyrophosphorylase/glucosamine-1-phosphate N-acetyltransferase
MNTIAVIMAAGQGTRMRSKLPKVLHPLLGIPMLNFVIQAATQVTNEKPVIVLGHEAALVKKMLRDEAKTVIQQPQLGTAHAVLQAETILRGCSENILVVPADLPLVKVETLQELIHLHRSKPGPLSLVTLRAQEPRGFGRILRDERGEIIAIVEEAMASEEQLAIRELNAGIYCFTADWLWQAIRQIPLSQKGEYFLTDLVEIAARDGYPVAALVSSDEAQFIGINDRRHLAQAELHLRQRINEAWMIFGVTIVDPATTYIEPGVSLGQDTVIWPNTYLQGETHVGQDCVLGPNTIIRDTLVGDNCRVFASVLEGAILESHVDVGPFGHLRKGAHLAEGVHMGNFGEVKNSYLGPGVKMGHFSYIGDAQVGPAVNIGAGTITCNFGLDGKKNKTEIGSGAFIGSDTLLIAPVKIGEGAATGSGAVVKKDVPDHTLAVGMPARAIRKLKE